MFLYRVRWGTPRHSRGAPNFFFLSSLNLSWHYRGKAGPGGSAQLFFSTLTRTLLSTMVVGKSIDLRWPGSLRGRSRKAVTKQKQMGPKQQLQMSRGHSRLRSHAVTTPTPDSQFRDLPGPFFFCLGIWRFLCNFLPP